MKAVLMDRHGGPDVLYYGDAPDPKAKAGEIVVDTVAVSVNGADWKVREGKAAQVPHFPYILGRDFSGVVSAVGEGVTDFRVGDEVFAVCDVGQEGAYAEKIAIKASIVARKPPSLSHVNATAVALTGLTAICTVEDTLKLKSGETILIQGGAGGVAAFAIQLAKHLGAKVITTASAANHDYLRKLGADEIIDYNAVDFTKVVKNVDAVFETVGGDVAQRSFAVLKPGGRAAFIASGPQAPKPDRTDVVALRPNVGRDRPHLERIVQLVTSGVVRPPETTFYRLSDAVAAHKVSESRHFRGKLIFQVR
jgi:NADPH:quinone reductase-like Zn-dependent oxidoreductase